MQDLVNGIVVNRVRLYATYGDEQALTLNAVKVYDQRRQLRFAEFEAKYPPKEVTRHVFQTFTRDCPPRVAIAAAS